MPATISPEVKMESPVTEARAEVTSSRPGIVRADRQKVVSGKELARLHDVSRAAPVHELIYVRESRRAVTDLDQVLRDRKNHDEGESLASREDPRRLSSGLQPGPR